MADQGESQSRSRNGGALATAAGSTLGARVMAQATQLALFLVAARVLLPADFGVFSIIVAISTLLFIFGAAGWSEFVLGSRGNDRATNQAIAYSVIGGYLMATIGVVSAAVCLLVFNAATLTVLILLFSATMFLAPITRVFGAILVRREKVFILNILLMASDLAGLAAGIYGLMNGWNIISLGAAKLVTQIVLFAGLMLFLRKPIIMELRGGYASEILEISRSILLSRVIGFVSGDSSTFLVGIFLGVANVGYFRAAERVVNSISEMLFEPMRLISWIIFRDAADDGKTPAEIRELLAQEGRYVFPLMILCSAPVFIGLAVISDDIVNLFLGETWLPAAPVVTILALSALLITPSNADEPLLTISGNIKVLPPVALFNAVVTVVVFLVFTQFGLLAAALARLASSVVVMATSFWMQGKHAGAPWWAAIKTSAPVYAGAIALVIAVLGANYWLVEQGFGLFTRLSLEVLVGAVSYFLVILLVRPSFLRSTLSLA